MIDNSENPLVSISCITYNHVHYIKDALDSFLMQKTDFSFEICLGEDESNDGTREICQIYAQKHPEKIRLFLRSRKDVVYFDGQPTGNYNALETFKKCKGKYVALCEGDDYWTDPYKLQKQVDFMKKENLVLSFHQGYWVDENLKMLNNQIPLLNIKWSFEMLLKRWPLTSSIMFDASIMTKEYYQLMSITWSGDQMLMLLAADKGDSGMINEYMCNHIVHSKGLTENLNKREWILNIIKSLILLDKLTKYHHHSGILSALNNLYYHFANVHSSSFFEKIKYITKAFINLVLYGIGDTRIFLYNCKLLIVKRK